MFTCTTGLNSDDMNNTILHNTSMDNVPILYDGLLSESEGNTIHGNAHCYIVGHAQLSLG